MFKSNYGNYNDKGDWFYMNNFNAKKITEDLIYWIKDWFNKNGKDCKAVIGISGGMVVTKIQFFSMVIHMAIESAKCRIYRLKANSLSTDAHQKKVENQQELMEVTIKALEFYRDEYE